MAEIAQKKIAVLSGKGGVGKSTIAVNIAWALKNADKKTGLLDADLHGPSIPTMLGLEAQSAMSDGELILPLEHEGLKIISIGFLMKNPHDAVIWRGPMKHSAITQMVKEVKWDGLDYLIVDLPPCTGDEPLAVCQSLDRLDGAVIVTTPQKVASADVRKAIEFCRQMKIPILAMIENMSGFRCPGCGLVTRLFPGQAGRSLASEYDIPFIGAIPFEPDMASETDMGRPFINLAPESELSSAIGKLLEII